MNYTLIQRLLLLCPAVALYCSVPFSVTYSQELIHFIASPNSDVKSVGHQSVVPEQAQLFQIDDRIIKAVNQKDLNHLILEIDNAQRWELILTEVKLLSDDYTSTLVRSNKIHEVTNSHTMKFYQGHLEGDSTSSVTLSLSSDHFSALIITKEQQYYIEPIRQPDSDTDHRYLVYDANKFSYPLQITCAHQQKSKLNERITKRVTEAADCVEIALSVAIDYAYVSQYFHDAQLAIDQSLHVLNMVSADFKNQFATDINFKIKEHVISTCATCDPWTASADAVLLLDDFAEWAQTGGFASDHDMGQLLTARDLHKDLDRSYVGYAHQGGTCSDRQYHVIEEMQMADWKRRVICAHEMGHNLSCYHDPAGSATIMSPTLTNSTQWSSSSIMQVNQFVNEAECLSNCRTEMCPAVQNISLLSLTATSIDLNWDPIADGQFHLTLKDLNNQSVVIDSIISDTEMFINHPFPPCQEYEISLINNCVNGDHSSATKLLFHTSLDQQFEIVDIQVDDCIPGELSQYELNLVLHHEAQSGTPLYIDIAGIQYVRHFSSSPQTLSISQLISTQRQSIDVELYTVNDGIKSCSKTVNYISPNRSCDLYELEDFNDCRLPLDWDIASTNQSYFSYPYDWSIGNDNRQIENYGKEENKHSSLSIDGSCMAYFDDDIITSAEYTGIIEMYSAVYDLSPYQEVKLELDYIFHTFADVKGANGSHLRIDVWDGNDWIIIIDEQEDNCPWFDIWDVTCVKHINLNMDAYGHSEFQIRFIYSDGNSGDWTGMIAFDNFLLRGQNRVKKGCTDPSALNFEADAVIDDGSCYSCENGIMDGQEIDIDCGGSACAPCHVACFGDTLKLTEVTAYTVYQDVDTISITARVDQPGISVFPGREGHLNPGFEVVHGFEFEVDITPCTK